jgi:16S rRNA (cytosine1402-N4)-methyltransferase
MKTPNYHIPVLLRESIAGLSLVDNGVYLDLTFGGGGHTNQILKELNGGTVVGFDQDSDVIGNLPEDKRFRFVNHNYRFMGRFLDYLGIDQVDGILADLGVSSHHLDAPERGFSFRFDAPLDMRMTRESDLTARVVVNDYPLEELARIFRTYGEMEKAGRWASQVVKSREAKPIDSTFDLVAVLDPLLKRGKENKDLAKVFQALRIEVNKELDGLREMLDQTIEYLKPSGRLVVISYHSLEDRLVKNFMRSGNTQGEVHKDVYGQIHSPFKVLTKKVVLADDQELAVNPRARSAKMRIAEKIV